MKTILFILTTVSFVYVLGIGLNRAEVVECKQWFKQIKENGKPELSGWEKVQCESHNIKY